MKALLALIVLFVFLGLSTSADSKTGPLQVDTPSDWTVQYNDDRGTQLYSLTMPQTEGIVILTFFRANSPDPQDFDSLKFTAEEFLKEAKKKPSIKLVSDTYTKGKFAGETFTGKFVLFKLANGRIDTMFTFVHGDEIWRGEFSGSPKQWDDAVIILKLLRKND